jgi:hypothetical protein
MEKFTNQKNAEKYYQLVATATCEDERGRPRERKFTSYVFSSLPAAIACINAFTIEDVVASEVTFKVVELKGSLL